MVCLRPVVLLAAALSALPVVAVRADPFADRDRGGYPSFPGLPPGRGFAPPDGLAPEPGAPVRRRKDEAAQPPKPQTPAERAAAVTKALAPHPPLATVRKQTLDDLYGKLAAATDEDEAKGVAGLIGAIWMRSSSDTANLLMTRALAAAGTKNYTLALQLLDQLVVLQPTWAEAWNERASVRYLAEDLDGSMADVDRVLKLEPRHFGALDGLATILERTGFPKRALEVYRRAMAVYPHQPAIEKIVEKLTLEVEGQAI